MNYKVCNICNCKICSSDDFVVVHMYNNSKLDAVKIYHKECYKLYIEGYTKSYLRIK